MEGEIVTFYLVPQEFKTIMNTIIKVGIGCEVAFCIALVIAGVLGTSKDLLNSILYSFMFLSIIPLALIPCLRHYRISQSTVFLSKDRLMVLDRKGNCWREIPYDRIHKISIESVAGFFYGEDAEDVKRRYICIFLNGCDKIPCTAFSKLFIDENFFMLHYDENAMALLSRYM